MSSPPFPPSTPSGGVPPRAAGRFKLDVGDALVGVLGVGGAIACYFLKGTDGVLHALTFGGILVAETLPTLLLSLLLAAFVQVLVSREKVSSWLGGESGMRGLLIATAAGMLVPGGPWTSFPIVYALAVAGADIGALVAFLSAWSLISLSRLVVWELPFLGTEFAVIRMVVSMPLPILAGMLARRIARVIPPVVPTAHE